MLDRPFISLEQLPVLRLADAHFPIEVRRSSRASRFSLKVSHTERAAILTLPKRGCVEDASAFLARHFEWLRRQIERLPGPIPFVEGAVIPVRGIFHSLKYGSLQRDRGLVWLEQSTNFSNDEGACFQSQDWSHWRGFEDRCDNVTLPKLHINGDQEHAARRFSDWLRSEVKKDLAACVERHSKTLKCMPKRISIRDQATRWGSCSTTGTLSFSWRLIFAPPFVLDYVAAHEVAHLREMNHGPRFWRLVRDAVPGMQKARIWLKTHGADLHRFGIEA